MLTNADPETLLHQGEEVRKECEGDPHSSSVLDQLISEMKDAGAQISGSTLALITQMFSHAMVL